jgi:UDP-glucose 4-epimerase
MRTRHALVTGAAGFIGRHVCRHLAQLGWTVHGIGHGRLSPSERKRWGIDQWRSSDITLSSLRRLHVRLDAIIHCAGGNSVAHSLAHPADDFHRNVTSLLQVLEYVRLASPGACVVYPSSAAVYGDASDEPLPETAPAQPVSPYGVHKRIAEELCRSYGAHYGVATTVIRLFSVYGPGLRRQLWWDACRKAVHGERTFWGTGKEIRDWLHVNDAAALLCLAIANASGGCPIVNGGSGTGVAVDMIVRTIFRAFHIKETPCFTGGQRPGDPLHYRADIRRAAEWGWSPGYRWEEGLSAYVEWFRSLRS